MLEFIPGPNNEIISKEEKDRLTDMLKKCNDVSTLGHQVNIAYNNITHFSSPQYNYNINEFLKALSDIVNSKSFTIEVMGSIHSDPFGHSSSLIGQMSQYGEFLPCLVQDKYIRFKVNMKNHINNKILGPLNITSIFHFLVDVPEIIRLQLHQRTPCVMYQLINTDGKKMKDPDLYPSSRYKYTKINVINVLNVPN
jgi:hypothetical protein